MIDFTLSPEQVQVRHAAHTFASTHLKDARAAYEALPTPEERFQSTKPILRKATELGLIKGQVPAALGGTGGSFVDAVLMVEELYAVEPSVSLTLLGTGLGLSTLLMGGSAEQHEEFLKPFLSGEGVPLASLVYSEPGGTANFFEQGGKGMQKTAKREGAEWVVNGEKVETHSHHKPYLQPSSRTP